MINIKVWDRIKDVAKSSALGGRGLVNSGLTFGDEFGTIRSMNYGKANHQDL